MRNIPPIVWYLIVIIVLLVALFVATLAVRGEAAGCTSSVGPDGGEERRCTVLWLPAIHQGGGS